MSQLVRDLSAAITASAASEAPPERQETLVSDVIAGVRYTLTRSAEQPPTPDEQRVSLELSAREFEIARLVAHGYPNKTIAAVLNISTWTVDTYLRRIFTKLGVRSRSAMVTILTRAGVLDLRHTTLDWAKAWRAATNVRDPPKRQRALAATRRQAVDTLPRPPAEAKSQRAG